MFIELKLKNHTDKQILTNLENIISRNFFYTYNIKNQHV